MHMIDGLPALQPRRRPDCPAWPVWYRVQTGAACPASGRVCLYAVSCMACPAACAVQSVRVRWGWQGSPVGYTGRAGGGVVDTLRRKNSKKAFLFPTHPLFSAQNAPPLLSISKIPRKNKKTPTKGLCSVLYLPYKP
nr:MAG TPA: hypothetical protein [Caudoviricetes sp.]